MKQFKDVAVGESFKFNGLQYTKVQEERISCCRSINAVASENEANRTFIQPNAEVEELTNP